MTYMNHQEEFIESVKVRSGIIYHETFHNERMKETLSVFFPASEIIPDVRTIIGSSLPKDSQLYKVRILYSEKIKNTEFIPYRKKEIKSLKVVYSDTIKYTYKSLNRKQIHQLLNQKDGCDDVVIVKNGLVTDSSFSNIICFDGQKWITPRKPLLNGTMRRSLLRSKKVQPVDIKPQDLLNYHKICLINAMLEPEEQIVKHIVL